MKRVYEIKEWTDKEKAADVADYQPAIRRRIILIITRARSTNFPQRNTREPNRPVHYQGFLALIVHTVMF
jgi:hypothetical protein